MIGCGMKMKILSSSTLQEAVKEAKLYVQGRLGPDGEYEECYLLDPEDVRSRDLDFVKLVKIECDLPIIDWYYEVMRTFSESTQKHLEAKELKEYQRLKAKFEGKGLG